MKANDSSRSTSRPRRSRRAGAAVAAVALVGLTACTSDPGPKRVAQDIINSIELENEIRAEEGLAPIVADQECLETELGRFSNGELESIAEDIQAENTDDNADGETALRAYELSLANCIS